MMHYLPLLLIPLCALLNHLGGQSTTIPDPRIVCRVIAILAVITTLSHLMLPLDKVAIIGIASLLGMALWAIPGWSPGFVCIKPCNDTRGDTWLGDIVNTLMGVSALDKLTPSQCWKWGLIYFSLRGLYIYPAFALLGYFLTPWAYAIGLGGALMGFCYGSSSLVLWAEWKFGAVIGAMFAGVLLCATLL
jgi:hypothetical protein